MFHCYLIYLDQIAKPLLQSALNKHLRGSRQFVTVGLKDQLHQATAECWAVNPLARRSEQYLFNHAPDVVIVVRICRSTAWVKTIWKVDIHNTSHPGYSRLSNCNN